jgi:hypothetical protein
VIIIARKNIFFIHDTLSLCKYPANAAKKHTQYPVFYQV